MFWFAALLLLAIQVQAAPVICSGLDDTIAIQAALNAGTDVELNGACVAGNLTIGNNGTRLHGSGGAILTFKAGATGDLISTTTSRTASIDNLRLEGLSATDTKWFVDDPPASNRSAIAVAMWKPSRLSNLRISGFDNACIRAIATDNSGADIGARTVGTGLHLSNCYTCLKLGPQGYAEYTTWAAVDTSRCRNAVEVNSGNVSLTGVKGTASRVGLFLNADNTNNGHGHCIGCVFNHNTLRSLHAEGITIGFTIIGQLHVGDIYIRNSAGIKIENSIIQTSWMIFEGGGRNVVRNNFIFTGGIYKPTVVHDFLGHNDCSVLSSNDTSTGAFPDSHGAAYPQC